MQPTCSPSCVDRITDFARREDRLYAKREALGELRIKRKGSLLNGTVLIPFSLKAEEDEVEAMANSKHSLIFFRVEPR